MDFEKYIVISILCYSYSFMEYDSQKMVRDEKDGNQPLNIILPD